VATTSIETSAKAKVTDYEFERFAVIRPPDFWTVEVDGRELHVFSEYEEGTLEIRSVYNAKDRKLKYANAPARLVLGAREVVDLSVFLTSRNAYSRVTYW
jgi:hypothetical protein